MSLPELIISRVRCAILLLAIAFPATGQRFDVASVKLDTPGTPPPEWKMDHGSFTVSNTVTGLIQTAYNLANAELIEGGPAWMERSRYDVVAKGDPAAGPEQIRIMLQALLEERFHLKAHREPKTLPGYSLIVDPKKATRLPKAEEPSQQQRTEFLRNPHGGFWAYHANLDQICVFLWTEVGPVVNQTGLRGVYSFHLDYNTLQPQVDAARDEPHFGTIFSALENIGLKLAPTKVPVEVLHVDRLDRPSAN